MTHHSLFPDKKLANRIELLDARCQDEFVATHARACAGSTAESMEIGGGVAAFVSPDSPISQVIGMGFSNPLSENDLAGLEGFYSERNTPVHIELSHMANPWALQSLEARGYRATEFSTVHALTLTEANQVPESDAIFQVDETEFDRYGDLLARGFTGAETAPPDLAELGRVFAHEEISTCFVSTRDGQWAGAGALFLLEDVAFLSGAATLPVFRGRGVQTELLKVRLAHARSLGAKLAVVVTEPGSISHYNVWKLGFQNLYARTKLSRAV